MKKILTVVLAAALAAVMAISCFAANVPAYSDRSGSPDSWLGNGNNEYFTVTFNSSAAFKGICFPQTWCPAADSEIIIEAIQNDAVVASVKAMTIYDIPEGFSAEFDKAVPAGVTTIKISIGAQENEPRYFVLPSATYDETALTFDRVSFAFELITDDASLAFIPANAAAEAPAAEEPAAEEPAVAEAPAVVVAPAAQTADLAVVAIIALGAFAAAKKH